MRSLKDLVGLLLLFLFLPLLILLLGPFLVVSALWGRASFFGALQFEPGKHHRRGRDWAFSVGLLVWILTWGSLMVFRPGSPVLPMWRAAWTPSPVEAVEKSPPASPLPAPPTASVTLLPPTATATALPAPSKTPLPAATATSRPSATPTVSGQTQTPPPRPTLAPSVTATGVSATPAVMELDAQQVTAVLQSLVKANNLLTAVLNGSAPGGSADLEQIWRNSAAGEVKNFVRTINAKYRLPVEVRYNTIGVPQIKAGEAGTVYVSSREEWVYQGEGAARSVVNDYHYTFQREGTGWVITSYRFNAVAGPVE